MNIFLGDDWLTITPEDLDQMMLKMWGQDYEDKNKEKVKQENLFLLYFYYHSRSVVIQG